MSVEMSAERCSCRTNQLAPLILTGNYALVQFLGRFDFEKYSTKLLRGFLSSLLNGIQFLINSATFHFQVIFS